MILASIRRFLNSDELLNIGRLHESSFTRERIFTFKRLTLFILNLVRKTLQIEIANFTKSIGTQEASKQAFSQARKNLNPVVFNLLNEKFITEYYTDNNFKTLHGFRILDIDGSKIQLPFSSEIAEKFGFSHSQHGPALPMARASIMFDILNKVAIHSLIMPINTSERGLAVEHFNNLLEINKTTGFDQVNCKDLLLFDRGYPSVALMTRLSI